MSLRSSFRKLPLLFWLIPLVIIVNVIQFYPIRDAAGKRWGALHRIPSADVFDKPTLSSFTLFKGRLTLYKEMGDFAPNSKIIVPNNIFFHDRSNFRSAFIAHMRTIGQSSTVDFVNIDNDKVMDASNDLDSYLISHGEISIASSGQGPEVPTVTWEIYSTGEPSGAFVLVANDDNTLWRIIDSALLPNEVVSSADD